MSWLQGKVNCFDVDEVCSPQILSVLAELSGKYFLTFFMSISYQHVCVLSIFLLILTILC